MRLGDIVETADASHTVRAVIDLPVPVGAIERFIVLGELDRVLGVPLGGDPLGVFFRCPRLPDPARCRSVCEGATAYWAPHLPARSGAMGELLWRVLAVRGQLDPVLVLYRAGEPVPFQRAEGLPAARVRVLYLPTEAPDTVVTRHGAVVHPVPLPTPAREPRPSRPLPADVPARPLR